MTGNFSPQSTQNVAPLGFWFPQLVQKFIFTITFETCWAIWSGTNLCFFSPDLTATPIPKTTMGANINQTNNSVSIMLKLTVISSKLNHDTV